MDQERYPLVGKALCYIRVPIISKPKKPDLYQGESTTDRVYKVIFQEEIKSYVK